MNSKIQWNEKKTQRRRDPFHPVVRDYAEKRLRFLFQNGLKAHGRALELGAGDGFFSLELEKTFELTVTDNFKAMLERNPSQAVKKILAADATGLKDQDYDLVFEANMLHHAEDEVKIAQEMARLSREFIVMIEPNPYHPLTILLAILLPSERKSLVFTQAKMAKLFQDTEFEVIKSQSFGVIPANRGPLWLCRLLRPLDGALPFLGLENIVILRKLNKSFKQLM